MNFNNSDYVSINTIQIGIVNISHKCYLQEELISFIRQETGLSKDEYTYLPCSLTFGIDATLVKMRCNVGLPLTFITDEYAPEKPLKTRKASQFTERLSLRFGTDLLSHVLPQYHRLWWA